MTSSPRSGSLTEKAAAAFSRRWFGDHITSGVPHVISGDRFTESVAEELGSEPQAPVATT